MIVKRVFAVLIAAATVALLSCCNAKVEQVVDDQTDSGVEMLLKIDDTVVAVEWENNRSVDALFSLAEGGLTVKMEKYGGFEQVGDIGVTLPSDDRQMTTECGDIVLYASSQLVIFYGSNSWRYTKLGKINASQSKIISMLSGGDVTVTIGV